MAFKNARPQRPFTNRMPLPPPNRQAAEETELAAAQAHQATEPAAPTPAVDPLADLSPLSADGLLELLNEDARNPGIDDKRVAH